MDPHNHKHAPCERHPKGRPVSTCPGCGKTVCSECIKQYGYFCSEECRAIAHETEPDTAASDYTEAQQRYDTIVRILFKRVPLAVLAIIVVVVLIRWMDKTGGELWRVALPGSAGIAQLIEDGETVFVLDHNGLLSALNASTGEERWTRPAESAADAMTLLGDALYLESDGALRCLDEDDGNSRWELAMDDGVYDVKWQAAENGLIAGHTTFTSSTNGEVEAWTETSSIFFADPSTGDVRWRRSIDSQSVHRVGFFAGQPWCLTFASDAFQLEVLNPTDGRRVWGMRAQGDEAPPVLATENRLLLVLQEEVIAFASDGSRAWSVPLEKPVTQVTQSADHLVLCLASQALRCIDIQEGKTLWSTTFPGGIGQASAGDRMVYATVAGWMKEGEAPSNPLGSMPDGPEKQLLQEMFFDEGEDEDTDGGPTFAEVDRLAAYDLRRGKLKWDERIDNGTITAGPGCCYLTHYVSGMGSLLGGDTSGRLIARAASDGDVLWRFKADADLSLVAVGEQAVYLEETKILPEMLTKYGGGRPPEISLAAVQKRGFLYRLTHW